MQPITDIRAVNYYEMGRGMAALRDKTRIASIKVICAHAIQVRRGRGKWTDIKLIERPLSRKGK